MRKFIYSILAAASLVGMTGWAVSCNKPDPTPEPEPDPTPVVKPDFDPNATISFTREPTFEFGGDGGSTSVVFTCTGYWELEIPEDMDWVTSSALSGEGSSKRQSLTLTVAANPSDESRKGKIVLNAGGDSKKITVKQEESVLILTEADVPDLDKIYIPNEFRNMDLFRSDATWSFCRSRQSEHFIVFWGKNYGSHGTPTPTEAKVARMRVDIDDLLEKAEEFYQLNINTLGFAEEAKSVVSKYKMIICLLYQNEWLATGSGYDNKIGALWVNPSTCQPVGSTIGHEIGHSFQYMVYCDYLLNSGAADDSHGPGWRYGFGPDGKGGNAFWEQTAQWQSMQIEKYRGEAFTSWYGEYVTSTHLHVLHERPRYANYFIHWWWVERNGKDISFIGKLWREAKFPEDPCETYMRITGMDVDAFNDDIWNYAAHMMTWDTDEIRSYGKSHIGQTAITNITRVTENEETWWRISAAKAPESTGSNAIRIALPTEGQDIKVTFQGLRQLSGCVTGNPSLAGWRYGFVAYDGTDTHYSDIWSAENEEVTYTVPEGTTRLWFVVTGAPKEYERHPWADESDDKDIKWPWQVKFEGAKPHGK